MTDSRTAGALWAAAALCFPLLALSQSPAPKVAPGGRGATGAIVQFEESKGSAILYLEEKGGLVSSVPGAPPTDEEALPVRPIPKAPAVVKRAPKQPSVALSRVAQRKLTPSDGVATKP